ncbi:hypothetical protein D3C76_1323210 [compost metagenome]
MLLGGQRRITFGANPITDRLHVVLHLLRCILAAGQVLDHFQIVVAEFVHQRRQVALLAQRDVELAVGLAAGAEADKAAGVVIVAALLQLLHITIFSRLRVAQDRQRFFVA